MLEVGLQLFERHHLGLQVRDHPSGSDVLHLDEGLIPTERTNERTQHTFVSKCLVRWLSSGFMVAF